MRFSWWTAPILGSMALACSDSAAPVTLDPSAFRTVSVGNGYACALTNANSAYCWGRNDFAEFGDGTTIDQATPAPAAGGLKFTNLSAGPFHACGVTPAGAIDCWGMNRYGQLGGTTDTNPQVNPVAVAGGLSFRVVSAGESYTCGTTATRAAYCWGGNQAGQLGDGTTSQRFTPVAVVGGLSFDSLATAYAHVCGRSALGASYCRGDNTFGQLGDGTTNSSLSPVPVPVISDSSP